MRQYQSFSYAGVGQLNYTSILTVGILVVRCDVKMVEVATWQLDLGDWQESMIRHLRMRHSPPMPSAPPHALPELFTNVLGFTDGSSRFLHPNEDIHKYAAAQKHKDLHNSASHLGADICNNTNNLYSVQ
jgi:hypothetical protein